MIPERIIFVSRGITVFVLYKPVHTQLECINYTHWRCPFKRWNMLHLRIVSINWQFNYIWVYFSVQGTLWCSWLRHCATSREVVGSIPDKVIGIFYWHNPSDRTMALVLTQPLTEMSTMNFSCGVKAAGVLGWKPYHSVLRNLGSSNSWNPQSLSRPVMGLLYLYLSICRCIFDIATSLFIKSNVR